MLGMHSRSLGILNFSNRSNIKRVALDLHSKSGPERVYRGGPVKSTFTKVFGTTWRSLGTRKFSDAAITKRLAL